MQIISFPFKPYLAKFLFYSISSKEAIEDALAYYKPLDVRLNSIDGKIIRMMMKRLDHPMKDKIKHGFRLWIQVTKQNPKLKPYIEDGRYSELALPEDAIELINEMWEVRFRNHFISFVSGAVRMSNKKKVRLDAIKEFMRIYDLTPEDGITIDALIKVYDRSLLPTKVAQYEKKSAEINAETLKNHHKEMISKYL